MTKRFGFTLAEVLITLGIIGVVAAMTIPTLISNTNGAQFKTAYKKALSTLNQAVLMNIAMDDEDFSTIIAENSADTVSGTKLSDMLIARMQSATDITDSYFTADAAGTALPQITYETEVTCTADNIGDTVDGEANTSPCKDHEVSDVVTGTADTLTPSASTVKVYSFADGTAFGYDITAASCSDATKGTANACLAFIDVNGSTGPNTVVECDTVAASGDDGDAETACKVSNITDIYPVYLHGQTVEPATDAARAVLFGK